MSNMNMSRKHNSSPTKFGPNMIHGLSAAARKRFTQLETMQQIVFSAENMIRLVDTRNESDHQIYAQSV